MSSTPSVKGEETMQIGIPKESSLGELRVAATPATVVQGGIAEILRNGGDVYGIFQFSGLNVLWNFYRSVADVHLDC